MTGFRFCRDVFVFALRFLFLPWHLWATVDFFVVAARVIPGTLDIKFPDGKFFLRT